MIAALLKLVIPQKLFGGNSSCLDVLILVEYYMSHVYVYLYVFIFGVFCLFVCLFFLRPHPRHMEVPRLGPKLELQLLAYATTTAMPDPSCICYLHDHSRQHQILNPLSKARDQTLNLMVPSWICFCCAMTGTPICIYLSKRILQNLVLPQPYMYNKFNEKLFATLN